MVEDSRQEARDLLARAVEFHRHLGPFLILGLRMGMISRSMLKAQNHTDLTAIMLVDPKPPVSCAVDGVQVASGCTLGKGTIRVSEASDRIVGRFGAEDRVCTVAVKHHMLNEFLRAVEKATDKAIIDMAENAMTRSDEQLFEITQGS